MLTLSTAVGSPRSVATLAIAPATPPDCLDRLQETLRRLRQSELALLREQPDTEIPLQHRQRCGSPQPGKRQPPRLCREVARLRILTKDSRFASSPWPNLQVILVGNSNNYRLIMSNKRPISRGRTTKTQTGATPMNQSTAPKNAGPSSSPTLLASSKQAEDQSHDD